MVPTGSGVTGRSTIPRIAFDDLPAPLAEALRPRVERLGSLGEFFQVAAHQPDALGHFVAFTEAAKGGLPDRLVEVVALTAAAWAGNRYERHQHERLAVALGFGVPWVRTILARAAAIGTPAAGAPAADIASDIEPELEPDERAVQDLVLAALHAQPLARGPEVDTALAVVVARLGPELAMAVLLLLGRFLAHAVVVNACAIEPPVGSVLDG